MSLYDELKSRLTFIDDELWDRRDPIEKGLILVADVSGAAVKIYQRVRGSAEQQEELAAAIAQVHDELIAPIDIPGLGAVMEGIVDRNLGVILGGIVKPIDARLDKVLPNPQPVNEPQLESGPTRHR